MIQPFPIAYAYTVRPFRRIVGMLGLGRSYGLMFLALAFGSLPFTHWMVPTVVMTIGITSLVWSAWRTRLADRPMSAWAFAYAVLGLGLGVLATREHLQGYDNLGVVGTYIFWVMSGWLVACAGWFRVMTIMKFHHSRHALKGRCDGLGHWLLGPGD